MELTEFFDQLYAITNTDDAIDYVFDIIDRLCYLNQFETINQMLVELSTHRVDRCLLIAFLTITACVKHKLPYRATFLENAKTIYRPQVNQDKLIRLFDGLE